MFRKTAFGLAAAAVAVAGIATSTGGALAWNGNGGDEGSAYVRAAHLSPDAPNVDIYADGAKVLSNVPYKTVSPYLKVTAGRHEFKVNVAGTPTTVIDAKVRLGEDRYYTLAAEGAVANITGVLYSDRFGDLEEGGARVRVIHASPVVPAIDVAVQNGPTLFRNLVFKKASRYATVPGGTYPVDVLAAGSSTVLLGPASLTVQDNTAYTVFAIGGVGGQPVELLPVLDATGGGGGDNGGGDNGGGNN